MAKQVINIRAPESLINVGRTSNDRSGDPLRSAFTKINDAVDKIDSNFTELYARSENTDSQTLSLVNDTLTISGGNSVDLSKYATSGGNTESGNILSTVSVIPSVTGTVNTVTLSEFFNAQWPDGLYTVNFAGGGYVQIQIISQIASVYQVNPGTTNTWNSGDTLGTLTGIVGADIIIQVATIIPAPAVLALDKAVQKLTDGDYRLEAGVEGQLMYFVQQTGSTGAARVYVSNCRISGNEYIDNYIDPFINGMNNVVTMIYTDGAWQSLGGQWD